MDVAGSSEHEPEEITAAAKSMVANLLPEKSKKLYEAAYHSFKNWCLEKNVKFFTENVMLVYFSEKAKTYKASTVWAQYSMVRSCMVIYDNIDISQYKKLVSFLKRNSDGFSAKKSKIFTSEQVQAYLSEADNSDHLVRKVALIFGISGACRTDELTNLSVDNIEDVGSSLIITLPNTKNKKSRTFVVTSNWGQLNILQFYRKYAALRPPQTTHRRFFIFYKNEKCTVQPIGKNTLGKIPNVVAKFLKLPTPELYTGHCMRRSSTTLLADAGADITTIKRHGGWKSTAVAEGYIEDSIANKENIAKQIMQATSGSKTTYTDAAADITTIKRHGGCKSTAVAEGYIEDSVANKENIAEQILQGTSGSKTTHIKAKENLVTQNVESTSTSNTVNVMAEKNIYFSRIPGINFHKCKHLTVNFNVNK